MNLIYDISVLGAGHRSPLARTGVFRVIENLALQLLESTDLNINFCTTQSQHILDSCIEYLALSREFEEVPFLTSSVSVNVGRDLHKKIGLLNERISYGKLNLLFNVYLRLVRRLLFVSHQCCEGYTRHRLISYISKEIDIFHSTYHPTPDWISSITDLKIFTTVYDLIPLLFPQFFSHSNDHLVKYAVNGIDSKQFALCISEATRNDLCNYSKLIDPQKVFVTPLAASELFYPCPDSKVIAQAQQKYGIPTNIPYVLSLSTLEPRKNISQAIRSFAKMVRQEHIAELNLVLVGTKGWDYEPIFAEISKYGNLTDRIIVTGYVDDQDLAAIYSGAVMFVYPSFYEGFGLPPLEAMQCGVPVITSNTSSLPEVVGEAGFMVDPTDEDGLCSHMLNLYNDQELRAVVRQKSLEQAQKFSWRACAEKTVQSYNVALTYS